MTVQQTILQGIHKLLHQHDYLVIPGFGGFVLKKTASRFHANGMMVPPMKTVGFNVRLTQDDGILRSWLLQNLDCSESIAEQHIKDFSDYCSTLLKAKKRFEMPNIGLFYLTLEGQIGFEPLANQNFDIESFGLSPLSVLTLPEKLEERKPERTLKFEDRPSPVVSAKPVIRKRTFVGIIALVALFLAMASLLLNQKISGPILASLFAQNQTLQYQALNYQPLQLKSTERSNRELVANYNGIGLIEVEGKSIAVDINSTNSLHVIDKVESIPSTPGSYELVAGCFSVKANASKMLLKLKAKGLIGKISDKQQKGMYVVTAGTYLNHELAEKAKQELDTLLPKSWIRSIE